MSFDTMAKREAATRGSSKPLFAEADMDGLNDSVEGNFGVLAALSDEVLGRTTE
jgi:hypothetical protein